MTKGAVTLEDLMRSGLAGDRRAYEQCLLSLAPPMRAMARRCLPAAYAHAAEDVVQEALLTIHLKRGSWDSARPLMPWVRVIVKYKAIDMLRAQRGQDQLEPLEEHRELGAPQGDPLSALQLEQALSRLSQRDHALVRGHAVEGLDTKTLAATYGLSQGAVRVAFHRSLKRLADLARKDQGWTQA